jgi:hypothetical protein
MQGLVMRFCVGGDEVLYKRMNYLCVCLLASLFAARERREWTNDRYDMTEVLNRLV